MHFPHISIITPSFNQGRFIEKTILSVLHQGYPSFEHIIVDGGSTDNTLEILQKYDHLKWISESDRGQADALNKGLRLCSGNIVGWINSDDYYEENIFSDVHRNFANSNVNWVIGNIFIDNRITRKRTLVKSREVNLKNLLINPDIVIQPSAFFRRSILAEAGGWNANLYMTMDYDLWLRLCKISPPTMIDKAYAYFTIHQDQKSTSKNILANRNELFQAMWRENANPIYIAKTFLKKSAQYLYSTL